MHGRIAVVTGGTFPASVSRSCAGWPPVARGWSSSGGGTLAPVHTVAREVGQSTGNPEVEGLAVADLAVRSAWKSAADELARRLPAIHVLVHNAGAVFTRREITTDGNERTLALNVLAPLALTAYLQEKLRASAPARVVNIASAAHQGHHLNLDDLQSADRFSGFSVYGRSKLDLILLSRELALRLPADGGNRE